jgi:glucosamine--fructose-6-phosphate aminotransferase (isomerizing)
MAKTIGGIANLKRKVKNVKTSLILMHTRWATHGKVSLQNAHPHTDCEGKIFLVHNGIIENSERIKENLGNHLFKSETDSEVIAHYLEEKIKSGKSVEEAIRDAFREFKGNYAVVFFIKGEKKIYAFKKGSPLVVGI